MTVSIDQIKALQTGGAGNEPCFSKRYSRLILNGFFLLPFLFLTSNAYAIECNRKESAQWMMDICAQHDFQTEEDKQTGILQKLKAKISHEGWGKLEEAQKAWKVYRKTQCEFEVFGFREGSIYPTIYSDCLKHFTSEQNKRLLDQLSCEEGGLGCGGQ